jgi:hypothetical protein
VPFACYIQPDEFYAAHNVSQWLDPADCETGLRNAAVVVANDLRIRGIDTSKVMPSLMLVGTTYHDAITVTSDYTGGSVASAGSSRLVVETTTEQYTAVFGLQGSKNGTHWETVRNVTNGAPLQIVTAGIGVFSARFFEQYPYYRLTGTISESVTFTAFLIDESLSYLIEWKAIEEALFSALDGDTRVQQLYDAAREQYAELLSTIKAQYDASTAGTTVTTIGEVSMQRGPKLFR